MLIEMIENLLRGEMDKVVLLGVLEDGCKSVVERPEVPGTLRRF